MTSVRPHIDLATLPTPFTEQRQYATAPTPEPVGVGLGLRILTLNVCGIRSKVDTPDFIEKCRNYDVLCLNETKTDDIDTPVMMDKFKAMGFSMTVSNRHKLTNWRSGGVIIAVNLNLKDTWVQKQINSEISVCIQFNKKALNYDRDLVILAVYIPPFNTRYSNVGMFDELTQIIIDVGLENNYFLMCGDVNAHTQEREDFIIQEDDRWSPEENIDVIECHVGLMEKFNIPLKRKSTDVHRDIGNYGSALLDLCRNLGFCIMNGRCGKDQNIGKATTTENSLIDYIIGSPFIFNKVRDFRVHEFDPLLSDKHCIVEVSLEGNIERVNHQPEGHMKHAGTSEKSIAKWDAHKVEEFIQHIQLDKLNKLLLDQDKLSVDEITREASSIMINSAVATFSKSKARTRNAQKQISSAVWYNKACRSKRQEYLKAKRLNKAQRSEDSARNVRLKSKDYKREMFKAQKEYRDLFNKELLTTKGKDPKRYWKLLNGPSNNKGQCPIPMEDLASHFKSLSEWDMQMNSLPVMEEDTHSHEDSMLSRNFTVQEIQEAIFKLKSGKAAGVDQILNEYIKSTAHIFMPVYVSLFNKILDTGTFPEDWTLGLIVPIFKKKGNIDDCNNYRGITLLSCLGKLFTNVLNTRLTIFCEEGSILSENQAGFRKNYSTTDHIFTLKHIIDLFCLKKKRLFCTFIDYSKAFDTVWRDALWYKMAKVGIKGKFMTIVKNMYESVKSCVFMNGMKSESFISLVGVRQGENLSPLLFSLFINDLEDYLLCNGCQPISFHDTSIDSYLQLMVLLYADDTIAMSNTKEGLQKAIDQMCGFCQKWKLKINSEKTKVTVFGNRKADVRNLKFVCNGEILEIVHSFKYLGITMNYNGSFKIAIEELHKQASRAMYSLLSKCRTFNLPVVVALDLFDKLVSPIMLYASEVWGFEKAERLEKLHLRFLKYILKVKTSTCSNMVYGELGRYPIFIQAKSRLIGYWARLIEDKENKLSRIMYNCLFNMYNSGVYKSPWISQVKQILDNCGLSYIWLSQECNTNWLKLAVEQSMKDQFLQKWKSELSKMTSCDIYIECKQEFKLENYLMCENHNYRQAICNFRLNNTRIPKVTGRFKGLERSQRVCTLCNNNSVGDEFHVIFECKNQSIMHFRRKYLPKFYTNRPSMWKLILLLQNDKPKVFCKLGAFLKNVLPLFK